MRGFRYLDGMALSDAAFEAWGGTFGELCASASDALLQVMVGNPEDVEEKERRRFSVTADSDEMLLFHFLGELVYLKDAEHLLLRVRSAHVSEGKDNKILDAEACGECIDPSRHELIVDVKAVTLHRLAVKKFKDGWKATVVLDI